MKYLHRADQHVAAQRLRDRGRTTELRRGAEPTSSGRPMPSTRADADDLPSSWHRRARHRPDGRDHPLEDARADVLQGLRVCRWPPGGCLRWCRYHRAGDHAPSRKRRRISFWRWALMQLALDHRVSIRNRRSRPGWSGRGGGRRPVDLPGALPSSSRNSSTMPMVGSSK